MESSKTENLTETYVEGVKSAIPVELAIFGVIKSVSKTENQFFPDTKDAKICLCYFLNGSGKQY